MKPLLDCIISKRDWSFDPNGYCSYYNKDLEKMKTITQNKSSIQ